jgi:hypothetical protein
MSPEIRSRCLKARAGIEPLDEASFEGGVDGPYLAFRLVQCFEVRPVDEVADAR